MYWSVPWGDYPPINCQYFFLLSSKNGENQTDCSEKFSRWGWGWFCWRSPLCRGSIPSPKVFPAALWPPPPLLPPSTHRLMFLLILSYVQKQKQKRKCWNLSIFTKLVLSGCLVSLQYLSEVNVFSPDAADPFSSQQQQLISTISLHLTPSPPTHIHLKNYRVGETSQNCQKVPNSADFHFSANLNHFSLFLSPNSHPNYFLPSLFTLHPFISFPASQL